MSETWKGVPPQPGRPDRQPFSPEQEARIREIVREVAGGDHLADAAARSARLVELGRKLEDGSLNRRRRAPDV